MQQGLVIETQRRHSVVQLPDSSRITCISKGRGIQLACGDQVSLSTSSDKEGIIESVGERISLLPRRFVQRKIGRRQRNAGGLHRCAAASLC